MSHLPQGSERDIRLNLLRRAALSSYNLLDGYDHDVSR